MTTTMTVGMNRHPLKDIPDGVLETGRILAACYTADPAPKISLLDGIYRNEDSSPYVPSVLREVRKRLLNDSEWHHEYPPFLGEQTYLEASERLFFGADSQMVSSGHIASVKTVGGTGACHMAALLLLDHYVPWRLCSSPKLYLQKDTWINYRNVFRGVGIRCVDLPYYDATSKKLDFHSFKGAIENLPPQSVLVLQAAAHNPTGCDPSLDQWRELSDICVRRDHFVLLDSAYLGLMTGNPESSLETGSIRIFAEGGIPMMLVATYGKCFSLYGERVGILCVPTPNLEVKARLQKQMVLLARSKNGASPCFGARIVTIILTDCELRAKWEGNLAEVAGELKSRRKLLRKELEACGAPGSWNFLTEQAGFFSYLGLSELAIDRLREEHHIYMEKNGRVCFGTMYQRNIKRIAWSITEVMKVQKTME